MIGDRLIDIGPDEQHCGKSTMADGELGLWLAPEHPRDSEVIRLSFAIPALLGVFASL
jgi:hypothetical protein